MPEIVFECPICSVEIEADASFAGGTAQCPGCNGTIMVPMPGIHEGMEVAGFRLERKLGTGGMGEVWLSHQVAIDRKVALKILSPTLTNNKDFVARFMQEAKMAGRLEHPNIITAFDAGVDKGIYYLAVSFVDGIELKDKIRVEKIIPEKESLKIIGQIAVALRYAWEDFKILHRDIKPANIMIDRRGVAKLMDMGISKSISEDSNLTMTGVIMGTPYYMSPEQALAKADIDFRADIYSLGATLYHIVTGSVPYDAETAVGILTKHITDPFPQPKLINPNISDQCNALLEVMMAKKKDNRQKSWDDVILDIDLVAEGKMPATRNLSKAETFISGGPISLPENISTQKNENRINVRVKNSDDKRHAQFKNYKPKILNEEFDKTSRIVIKDSKYVQLSSKTEKQSKPTDTTIITDPIKGKAEENIQASEDNVIIISKDAHKKLCASRKKLIILSVSALIAVAILAAAGLKIKSVIDRMNSDIREKRMQTVILKLQKKAQSLTSEGKYQEAAAVYKEYSGEYSLESKKRREELAKDCLSLSKNSSQSNVSGADAFNNAGELQKALKKLNPEYDDSGRITFENGKITGINLEDKKINDISILGKITTLKSLNIRGCKDIKDITPLLKCVKLHKIIVPYGIKDLEKLKELESIQYIDYESLPQTQLKNAAKFWNEFDRKNMND
ncbi:MAG: hypothetical protein A2017_13380 [Lentisphaerae bacterium GWF2_44_16]|nr:MAG: hypothetical protein A2017_13380 [Lentisphaerae bacterium GWF2_44_16]